MNQLPKNVLSHLWNYKNHIRTEIGYIRAQNKQSDDYFEEQESNIYHQHLKDVYIDLIFILNGYKPHAES